MTTLTRLQVTVQDGLYWVNDLSPAEAAERYGEAAVTAAIYGVEAGFQVYH